MSQDVSRPLISVVMPVYNGERFIRAALESVLSQSVVDLEVLVVDDASTDDSVAMVEAFDDPRLTLHRNPRNLGPYETGNRGIALSRGAFVVRHDADDISLPERFAKQIHAFERDPDLVLVSSDFVNIDERGRPVVGRNASDRSGHADAMPFHLLFHNRIGAHSQVMMRGDVVRNRGGYPVEARYSQDHAMWLELAKVGKISVLPEVLLQYRVHASSISVEHTDQQRESSLRASALHLQAVLQRSMSIEEVALLRDFYTQNASDVDADSLSTIRRVVESIVSAYPDYFGLELSDAGRTEIRDRMGASFASCAYFSAKRLRPRSASAALAAAVSYSPRGALGFAVSKVRKRLARVG